MIFKFFGHLCLIFLLVFLAGKIDFSIFHVGDVLHETTHEDLFYKFETNQEGYVWTNGMSRRSHKVHISSLGTRQKDQSLVCGASRILATGSSSTFGSGLRDDEVWSTLVNVELDQKGVQAQVYNAANPGWGPYHWSTFFNKYSSQFNPDILLVPISYGDFTFYPITTDDEVRREWVSRDLAKKEVLNFDNFLSYSLRKGMYLAQALKNKYQGTQAENGESLGDSLDLFEEHYGNQESYIQDLVDATAEREVELVFFVRNADGAASGALLFEKLTDLSNRNTHVSVAQINAKDFKPGLVGKEIKTYYEKNLIIKNDGHPNLKYSELMSEKLISVLSEILKSRAIYKNQCG